MISCINDVVAPHFTLFPVLNRDEGSFYKTIVDHLNATDVALCRKVQRLDVIWYESFHQRNLWHCCLKQYE
jgi:hypothetical protein